MSDDMDIRHHRTDNLSSEAAYSDCGSYRYWLTRKWTRTGGLINFVMLNPSVADELKNDPTVERCERRARMLGFGGFCVTNIFAWRDTDPKAMRAATAPVGPENDQVLLEMAQSAKQVVVAWGTHGAHQGRGPESAALLRKNGIAMFHLGLSQKGHPRHPLYVPYSISPTRWKSG